MPVFCKKRQHTIYRTYILARLSNSYVPHQYKSTEWKVSKILLFCSAYMIEGTVGLAIIIRITPGTVWPGEVFLSIYESN